MSRALPFTESSLARAIKGVEKAGRFVVGVKPDGTHIAADISKPALRSAGCINTGDMSVMPQLLSPMK